ncbi:MAG: hypothetical protein IPL65_02195 [Lewinellaceae bacterium]|nr:hypothetical protein [Lewinellaceae bacterium]
MITGFCGTLESDVFYGFIPSTPDLTVTVTPSNCENGDGLQIAILENCDNPQIIACNGGSSGGGNLPLSVSVSNLLPNHSYYLLIDGYAGDLCEFTINTFPPLGTQLPSIDVLGPVSGPPALCPDAVAVYSVESVAGAAAYTWTAPPGSLINGLPSPATIPTSYGSAVSIQFGPVGGQVSVKAVNACQESPNQSTLNVLIQPIPPTNLTPISLCANELPYDFCGTLCYSTGNYCCILSSWRGCDSIVCQPVTILPNIVTNLAPKYICAGDAVFVCGESFSETGSYSKTCTSFLGCDSIVNFSIIQVSPNANIEASGSLLSCFNDTIKLSASASAGLFNWTTLGGTILGTENSIVIEQPDTYILTNTITIGNSQCNASDTITIGSNFALPDVYLFAADSISCSQPCITLNGGSTTPDVSLIWTAPPGVDPPGPIACLAGDYSLTAIHPGSGCSQTATASVVADDNVPDFSISSTGDEVGCATPQLVYAAVSSDTSLVFEWTGPFGFTFIGDSIWIGGPGVYTLTAHNNNSGCSAQQSFLISGDFTAPSASAMGGVITCNNSLVTLMGASSTPGVSFFWIGPDGEPSTLMNPQVSLPGVYTLTVTAPNGCTSTATAIVTADTSLPDISVELPEMLDCNTDSILFVYEDLDLLFTSPGLYNLTYTNSTNGCTGSLTVKVNADYSQPIITLLQSSPDLDGQGLGSISIAISGGADPVMVVWTKDGAVAGAGNNLSNLHAGAYTAIATGANGCTSTLEVTISNVVGNKKLFAAFGLAGLSQPGCQPTGIGARARTIPILTCPD